MGSKNNPKNRGAESKKKVYNNKEVEPVVFYDTEKKVKYVSAKVSKSTEVVCGKDGNPLRWEEI